MNAVTKATPWLIDGLAVVHLAYGLVDPGLTAALGSIVDGGIVNTVAGHPDRAWWMWDMATGVALLGLGEVARWTGRHTGRLPARLGGWLLAIALPMVVLEPIGGGWLVAAVGVVALAAARRAAAVGPDAAPQRALPA